MIKKTSQECFTCDVNLSDCKCDDKHTYTNDHHDEGPICPNCGCVNKACDSDGLLYDESTTEYSCDHCSVDFVVGVAMSFAWICRPIKAEVSP